MGVAAGTYDRRITLKKNQGNTQSASGQVVVNWEPVAENIPARYVDESQGGGQGYEAEQRVSSRSVSFHIRDPRGGFPVEAGMQVIYNNKTYNINHVAEISRNVALILRCEMKDNT